MREFQEVVLKYYPEKLLHGNVATLIFESSGHLRIQEVGM